MALKKGVCLCVVWMSMCTCMYVNILVVSLSCLVLVGIVGSENKTRLSAGPSCFWGSCLFLLIRVMLACVGRFPGREESLAPPVSRSPPRHLRTTGRPMGPATLNTQTQVSRTNCLALFGFCWAVVLLVSDFCYGISGKTNRLFGTFGPSISGPCTVSSVAWGFRGLPGGCAVSTTVLLGRQGLGGPTDDRLMSCCFMFFVHDYFGSSWLRTRCTSSSLRWSWSWRRFPSCILSIYFCDFGAWWRFVFSGLAGLPLRRFPLGFWVGGGGYLILCYLLASCL